MDTEIRLLMLEDDRFDADLIQRQLRKSDLPLKILHVDNRSDYERELKSFGPDIIISDFSLPSIDGREAFELQQQYCPGVPFIMVSGTIGEENAVDLIKNGITDYALKDKIYTLIPKIKRALSDVEKRRVQKINDRKFRDQYDTLLEIAFLQSHQVRGPVSTVMGLIALFNQDNPADPVNGDVILNLKKTAEDIDQIIKKIIRKTSEIEHLEV